MKKILITASLALMVSIGIPFQSFATDEPVTTTANVPKDVDARTTMLIQRVEEIKAMDKDALSRTEKKELRKELKGIKKEMRAAGNGIYLSVGAIIIILLLLILIL